jgi:hypothetical protein
MLNLMVRRETARLLKVKIRRVEGKTTSKAWAWMDRRVVITTSDSDLD